MRENFGVHLLGTGMLIYRLIGRNVGEGLMSCFPNGPVEVIESSRDNNQTCRCNTVIFYERSTDTDFIVSLLDVVRFEIF